MKFDKRLRFFSIIIFYEKLFPGHEIEYNRKKDKEEVIYSSLVLDKKGNLTYKCHFN